MLSPERIAFPNEHNPVVAIQAAVTATVEDGCKGSTADSIFRFTGALDSILTKSPISAHCARLLTGGKDNRKRIFLIGNTRRVIPFPAYHDVVSCNRVRRRVGQIADTMLTRQK